MPALLAVTIGDPCGIGPEVVLKALRARPMLARRSLVIGDRAVLARHRLGRRRWGCAGRGGVAGPGPWLLDLEHRATFIPGRSSAAAGAASLAYLDTALALCVSGVCGGLVTAPVTKWAIDRVHPGFSGQTEYLAQAVGADPVAMAFVSDALRIVLLTRHLPLRQVPQAVDAAAIVSTVRLMEAALRRDFRIRRPRFAVCGLNPHAGECGLFGEEERRVLLPALRVLRHRGIRCEGPFAADGFFADPSGYDAVVCWYHDQGLIPFKMAARDAGAQLTVGLPFPRTSPDHGSALDVAGRDRAHPGSMIYAMDLAARLAR